MSLTQFLHDTWLAILQGISKPVPILMALFDGTLPFSTIFHNVHKASQSSITTQEKPQLDGRMDQWELEIEESEVPALGDDIPLYEKLEKLDTLNIDVPNRRSLLLASDQTHKVIVFGFLAFVVVLWAVYLRKTHVAAKKSKSEPTEEFKKLLRDDGKWESEKQSESQSDSHSESPSASQSETHSVPSRAVLEDVDMTDSGMEIDNSEVDESIADIDMEDAEGSDEEDTTRSSMGRQSVMSVDMTDDASDIAALSSFTMLPLAKDLDFTEEEPVALAGGVATLSLENDDAGINSPRKRPTRRIPQPLRRERKMDELFSGLDASLAPPTA